MVKKKNYIWKIEQGKQYFKMYSCSLSPPDERENIMENLLGSNFIVETKEKLKKVVPEYTIHFDCVIMGEYHDKNSLTTLFETERRKKVTVLEIYKVGKSKTCPLYNEIQDAFKMKYQRDKKNTVNLELYIYFYIYQKIEIKRKKHTGNKRKKHTGKQKKETYGKTKERNIWKNYFPFLKMNV